MWCHRYVGMFYNTAIGIIDSNYFFNIPLNNSFPTDIPLTW